MELKSEYDQLVSIYENANKVILTGNLDLDYMILNQLEVQDLSIICRTNKYAQQLCYNKDFWKLKFKNENLPYTSSPNSLIQWLDLYKMVIEAKQNAIDILLINEIEKGVINIINPIHNEDFLSSFILKIININYDPITRIDIDNNKVTLYHDEFVNLTLSKDQIITLLTLVETYHNDPYMRILSNDAPLLILEEDLIDYLQLYNHHIVYYRKGLLDSIRYLKSL